MKTVLTFGVAALMFVGIVGFAHAQTATPSPTSMATPTPTTTVPGGAPSTGFGK